MIKYWVCGIGLLILGVLMAPVAWIGWLIHDAEQANSTYSTGAEAQQSFTCNTLLRIPEQKDEEYPIIHDSRGMFDFSSVVIFKASTPWIGDFIREYGLKPSESTHEQMQLERRFREKKLDKLAAMVGSQSWQHYTGGRVSYTDLAGRSRQGYFEACINATRDKVMVHFHSFTTVEKQGADGM